MRVALLDLDGKMENLALMRLSTYYKEMGDEVSLARLRGKVSCSVEADAVFVSCLFSWNKSKANFLRRKLGATVGGTGHNLEATVPDVEPDYSLYGQDRAVGFISRGCGNRCPWCVVWRKEGGLHRVSTAESIVGARKEAIFLDNNFLALPDHMNDLEWLASSRVPFDFNQGLDAAFVTPENAALLKQCRLPRIRLALDSVDRIPIVERAVRILKGAGFSRWSISVYVLMGFAGLKSDLRRLFALREMGVDVFPMGFRDLKTGSEPMRGWNPSLYRKYKRLLTRLPQSTEIWGELEREFTP
jgi:hypothetical protein